MKRVRKDRSKTLFGKRNRLRRNYFKGMWWDLVIRAALWKMSSKVPKALDMWSEGTGWQWEYFVGWDLHHLFGWAPGWQIRSELCLSLPFLSDVQLLCVLSSSQSCILVDSRNYMFLLLVVLLCAKFLEREKSFSGLRAFPLQCEG